MLDQGEMRIAVLGSGAREEALSWHLLKSPDCESLHLLGRGSASALPVQRFVLHEMDVESIRHYCRKHGIELLVVGPEAPLVGGIIDALADSGMQLIGPSREAAQLEGSKVFAKAFMQEMGIPTAAGEAFSRTEREAARRYLAAQAPPYVLKADGLAAGKGVFIAHTEKEAKEMLDELLDTERFASASDQVLIERFLDGEELSCFALCAGEDYVMLPAAMDYKRAKDNDQGPNTGGMGALSGKSLDSSALREHVEENILRPTLRGLVARGTPYNGFLFMGLMITAQRADVLEYNVRLGDPEAQVVLARLQSNLLALFSAMRNGTLAEQKAQYEDNYALCVTLAAQGYPRDFPKGLPLVLPEAKHEEMIFHAATKKNKDGSIQSTGGRILSVLGKGNTCLAARNKAYALLEKIAAEKTFFRTDIGKHCPVLSSTK